MECELSAEGAYVNWAVPKAYVQSHDVSAVRVRIKHTHMVSHISQQRSAKGTHGRRCRFLVVSDHPIHSLFELSLVASVTDGIKEATT